MMRSGILLTAVMLFATAGVAQSKDEKRVRDVLDATTTAFVKNDMATQEKLWGDDESVTVFESGYANYGWVDYRDNHLAGEMKEIVNGKYSVSDVKVKVSGKTAWAIFKYAISGDANGRHFEGAGLGTAVLEKRNGKWVIVHWHSSAPRRQPAPATTQKPQS
jgi:ketosteroid isomerase-like protein